LRKFIKQTQKTAVCVEDLQDLIAAE